MANKNYVSQLMRDIENGEVKRQYIPHDECPHYFTIHNRVITIRDVNFSDCFVVGVIIGKMVLMNGDQYDDSLGPSLVNWSSFEKCPTISFNCLSRFLNSKGNASAPKLAKYLSNGNVSVIDYTYDDYVPYASKSPGRGYVNLHGNAWHRSGCVLVKYGERLIILGQDDDSYFGSEIEYDPKIKTVGAAIKALMPKRLWKNEGVERQGEWFFVPIQSDKLPPKHECICSEGGSVVMTKDSPSSANHIVWGDGILIKDNQVFVANPIMEHSGGDHPQIELAGWYEIVRNTALKSYSEQGVD